MSTRRKFTNDFKRQVVLEALKERMTLSELGQKFQIHQNLITTWKQEFLEKSKEIFDKPATKQKNQPDTDDLYKEIGKLKVENEFLKKNLSPYL